MGGVFTQAFDVEIRPHGDSHVRLVVRGRLNDQGDVDRLAAALAANRPHMEPERDSGRHPEGGDGEAGSGRSLPERPNEDSASPNPSPPNPLKDQPS